MLDLRVKVVNPRAMLKDLREQTPKGHAPNVAAKRLSINSPALTVLAAAVCLSAFGGLVVQAQDASGGVMSFIQQNSRPIARQAARPAPAYYAPQAFFPRSEPRRAPVVAAYAPYIGYAPIDGIRLNEPRRRTAKQATRSSSTAAALTLPAPSRSSTQSSPSNVSVPSSTKYCVRTCDGFFFPLSTNFGSAASDQAACQNLCPTAKVTVYIANGSAEIEDARNRETGRRYSQMANAASYRKQIDPSCTCSATGVGLTTLEDAMKDPTLRVGDIVMTEKGLRVFAGGSYPYRSGNFVGIEQASSLSGKSRDLLRRVQNASMPGRSGFTAADVRLAEAQAAARQKQLTSRKGAPDSTETADLRRAATNAVRIDAATIDGKRYVGPDIPTSMR